MLSQNQMVKRVKALEHMFDGVCTISVNSEYLKPNGATGFRRETVCSDVPCRLSYQSSPVAVSNTQKTAMTATQSIKLFLSAEIAVPESSEIIVTQYGTTNTYKCSGKSINRAGIQVIELVQTDEC